MVQNFILLFLHEASFEGKSREGLRLMSEARAHVWCKKCVTFKKLKDW